MVYGEGAVILYAFGAGLEDDAVVVDAVAAADDGFAVAEGIVGEADARAEVLVVGIFLEIDDVGHPHAWHRGALVRFGQGSWLLLPVRLESYSQRRPRLRVSRGEMR